jgi:hypothetical protein
MLARHRVLQHAAQSDTWFWVNCSGARGRGAAPTRPRPGFVRCTGPSRTNSAIVVTTSKVEQRL